MEKEFDEVADDTENPLQHERQDKQLCDNCKKIDYDRETLAEHFCIKCEEKLCLWCGREHLKQEEHLVVALNEKKESQKFKESTFCIDHTEELAELFCVCCRKVICCKCLKKTHRSHNCSKIADIADLVSKQAEAEYETLFDIQSHFDKEREKLFNEEMTFIKTVKEIETGIRKRCDEITEFVYSETKASLNELVKLKSERLEEIELERRKMEEHAFAFEKFKEYCEQIKNNAVPKQTCEAEGILMKIADDLKTRPGARWKSRLFSIQVSIQKADTETVLKSLCDAVGTLKVECSYKVTQSCQVELDEKEVYGMARLHDKLYVLSNSIFIRRFQHPFASIGEIKTLSNLPKKLFLVL